MAAYYENTHNATATGAVYITDDRVDVASKRRALKINHSAGDIVFNNNYTKHGDEGCQHKLLMLLHDVINNSEDKIKASCVFCRRKGFTYLNNISPVCNCDICDKKQALVADSGERICFECEGEINE